MISSMRNFASSKAAFLAVGLIIAQSGLPALAAESGWQDGSLGQSEWVTPSGSAGQAGSTADLGQSEWINPQSTPRAASGQTLGQSQWSNLQSSQARPSGGAVGQSGWMQPAGSSGQSGWAQPTAASAAPMQPAGNMSGQTNQAYPPFTPVNTVLTNNATMVPRALSQSATPQLKGAVSSSNSFGGADLSPLGDGEMAVNSTPAGFKDIGDASSGPAPGGMGMMGMGMGMGGSGMEEMIGNVMMIPMMMAASSGMLGGSFHTYGSGGGGFHTYGPGGGIGGQRTVSLSNPAGYYARRAAIRALRRVGR